MQKLNNFITTTNSISCDVTDLVWQVLYLYMQYHRLYWMIKVCVMLYIYNKRICYSKIVRVDVVIHKKIFKIFSEFRDQIPLSVFGKKMNQKPTQNFIKHSLSKIAIPDALANSNQCRYNHSYSRNDHCRYYAFEKRKKRYTSDDLAIQTQ